MEFKLISELSGEIVNQKIVSESGEILSHYICDLREEALKRFLIEAGWTPPADKKTKK